MNNKDQITNININSYISGTVTILFIDEEGSWAASGKFGGTTSQYRNEREWDLKADGKYFLNIIPLASNTDITTQFGWYDI